MLIQRLPGVFVGGGGQQPCLRGRLVCAHVYLLECVCVHSPSVPAEEDARAARRR